MIALRSRQDPSTQGVVWSIDRAVHILVHLHKTLQRKNPRLSHTTHATNFDAHCTLANIFVFYVCITKMTGTHMGTGFPSLCFLCICAFCFVPRKARNRFTEAHPTLPDIALVLCRAVRDHTSTQTVTHQTFVNYTTSRELLQCFSCRTFFAYTYAS